MADIFALAKSVDIVEVVQQYVRLYGPRTGHYLGLCPFHGDKKLGSFKVTPNKGIFKCWGCGMEGDSIDFVSSLLNVSAREAAIRICEDHHLITPAEANELREGRSRELNVARSLPKIPERPPLLLSKKRTEEELHKVYLAFARASGMTLTKRFLDILLNERKLDRDELGDYFVYPNPNDSNFWTRFRSELAVTTDVQKPNLQDKLLLGIPGFFLNGKNQVTFIACNKASLGIIVRNRAGRISGIQLRVMEPLSEGERRYCFLSSGFADGASRSRGTYGCSCGYVEDVLFPRGGRWCKAIAITEGRFKAVALAKMGFIAVNMHSISNWNPAGDVALALADKFKAKRFVLVYDQEEKNRDAARKAVLKSSTSLAEKLKAKLPTDFAVWDPQYGKGIDDVVNAGHRDKISRIPA